MSSGSNVSDHLMQMPKKKGGDVSSAHQTAGEIIEIPSKRVFMICLAIAAVVGLFTWSNPPSANLLGAEVFATVVALFLFGSIKYRIDKNAITYAALPIILVTFLPIWWPTSQLRDEMAQHGMGALWEAVSHALFSIHGLEKLVHGDTMLFILGLTFFVSVISQTRLLEIVSMNILRVFEGRVFATTLVIGGMVSFASGILDGVSMIGLTIRVLVIILGLAKIDIKGIEFTVMLSVVLTTVCGMWLAYGEPPNLIMKSNLGLNDSFFLTYSMPMAVVTFIIAATFMFLQLKGKKIALHSLDVLEQNIADIRFMQATRHGEVIEIDEMLQAYKARFGSKAAQVDALYQEGHHPISSMIRAGVDEKTVNRFIKEYLGAEFVEPVSAYYHDRMRRGEPGEIEQESIEAATIERLLGDVKIQRQASQTWGKLAFVPFIGLLIWHAKDHSVPLFISSFVGFGFALLGILAHTKMRKLALHEASHEYQEYLFLFPLFLSITMLTAVNFFDQLKDAIENGVVVFGAAHVAVMQYFGSGILSAILDNNVVADFASRAIKGMPDMFLFAAAQVAGYATGGSLTHIGSAQSVVAFAYILRYVDPKFTPLAWIKAMWKMVVSITVALTVMLYLISSLVGPAA